MANALANLLQKRVLLINYPSLGFNTSDIVIKYIFRESKLTDSVCFHLLLSPLPSLLSSLPLPSPLPSPPLPSLSSPLLSSLLLTFFQVIFFDECESIFISRDKAQGQVNLLLTGKQASNEEREKKRGREGRGRGRNRRETERRRIRRRKRRRGKSRFLLTNCL